MNIEVRTKIRAVLRSKLNGKENQHYKQLLIEKLNTSESSIKRWIAPGSTTLPLIDDLPVICDILNITLYELFDCVNPQLSGIDKQLVDAFKANQKHQDTIKKILDIK